MTDLIQKARTEWCEVQQDYADVRYVLAPKEQKP
jgi:hypothetical protein